MKLMSALMMTLMAGVLFNNTAIAGVQYDINDEHNCTDRHVSQGEHIDFAVRANGSRDGSMIVVSTTNIDAKLYKDGQDISDLLEPYINADAKAEGVFAYLDTVGNYRLVTTSSGQGSVCIDMPS